MPGLATMPVRQWPDVLSVLVVAVGVEIGLRLRPLPSVARWCGCPLQSEGEEVPSSEPSGQALTATDLLRLDSVARVMRHWPWDATCLRVALVAGHRLDPHERSLVVGVRLTPQGVAAHAWLLVDGQVLDPIGGAAGFAALRPVGKARA